MQVTVHDMSGLRQRQTSHVSSCSQGQQQQAAHPGAAKNLSLVRHELPDAIHVAAGSARSLRGAGPHLMFLSASLRVSHPPAAAHLDPCYTELYLAMQPPPPLSEMAGVQRLRPGDSAPAAGHVIGLLITHTTRHEPHAQGTACTLRGCLRSCMPQLATWLVMQSVT